MSKPVKREDLSSMIARWVKPETVEPSAKTLDPEVDTQHLRSLRRIAKDDDTFLRSLVSHYKVEGQARIKALATAIEEQNTRRAGDALHALEGNSANVGVMGVAGLSGKLYRLAEEGHLDAVLAEMPTLKATFENSTSVLESQILEKEAEA
jgi:HPt (histidine-containing phosphotransfer) domain-containing protein